MKRLWQEQQGKKKHSESVCCRYGVELKQHNRQDNFTKLIRQGTCSSTDLFQCVCI